MVLFCVRLELSPLARYLHAHTTYKRTDETSSCDERTTAWTDSHDEGRARGERGARNWRCFQFVDFEVVKRPQAKQEAKLDCTGRQEARDTQEVKRLFFLLSEQILPHIYR
jgi:hypothetical protein